MADGTTATCPLCGAPSTSDTLAEAAWLGGDVVARLISQNPQWKREDGTCPACVQSALLQTLLERGDDALHDGIQSVWPLDAEAAFGALPTPLRLHADPRYTGRGVTLALLDSGFYPHPGLIRPVNRIRAWVNAVVEPVLEIRFGPNEVPAWPGWDDAHSSKWHGLMTSTVAAGNGWLSHGLYSGLARDADLVLVRVRDERGRITNDNIVRALRWLLGHGPTLRVRVVSMSVAGDPLAHMEDRNPVDEAVAALVAKNITVIAAAGNDGERRLVPPATAPEAITVGGLDDKNTFSHAELEIWHSNYGLSTDGMLKPELVAPSMWVVAPILPGTDVAMEADRLFERRAHGPLGDPEVDGRIAELKLITPHYQLVGGTSFAAPIVASAVACMLEANPKLAPHQIRDILISSALPVAGASMERQGAGALDPGQAVSLALREQHGPLEGRPMSPQVTPGGIEFLLHDHRARKVQVLGSWDGWRTAHEAEEVEPGIWQSHRPSLPSGLYTYKFLIDGTRWLNDPSNPRKSPDTFGGLNSVLGC